MPEQAKIQICLISILKILGLNIAKAISKITVAVVKRKKQISAIEIPFASKFLTKSPEIPHKIPAKKIQAG